MNRRLWRWVIVFSLPLALWTGVGCAQVAGIRVAKENKDCQNGVKDNDETGVDCGGPCLGSCPDKPCSSNADCASGKCSSGKCATPKCNDKILNGMEVGIDKCPQGTTCNGVSGACETTG
jgi:hypothetical protein